ncbi:glycosyltransferase [Modestobacter roseus]|uniref:Glycosyl transferase family 2 n=1 Tax=Modestobacter roseus TaxID=1181884 RepID=A0A562IKV9_9ACTN|nr:glycosyltransferase family A protein [Modestobacter roseus]TWH71528.1 glycosyl transferase family 2 [Modestobacter roseus]
MIPSLTVVIPCHNAAETLGVQLDALAAQRDVVPFEVLICDNGCTDGTAGVALAHQGGLDVRVVAAADRAGAAHARNVGVRAARADWIAFVDADDEVAPGWVAAMVDALARHPFVAGRFDGARLNDPAVLRSRPIQQRSALQESRYGPGLPHAGAGNMGVHREVFDAVGGFDESLLCLEDTDFCWRVQLAGWPLTFVPEALLHMRLRSSLAGMLTQGRRYGAATAELEHRYPASARPATPAGTETTNSTGTPASKVAVPAGGTVGVGVEATAARSPLAGVRDLLRARPGAGALLWTLGWHVGHRTWRPEADRSAGPRLGATGTRT